MGATWMIQSKRTKPRRGPMRSPEYRAFIAEEGICAVLARAAGLPKDARISEHLSEHLQVAAMFAQRYSAGCFGRIDPAHTENNGTSSKGPDSSCAPLCRRHHLVYDLG